MSSGRFHFCLIETLARIYIKSCAPSTVCRWPETQTDATWSGRTRSSSQIEVTHPNVCFYTPVRTSGVLCCTRPPPLSRILVQTNNPNAALMTSVRIVNVSTSGERRHFLGPELPSWWAQCFASFIRQAESGGIRSLDRAASKWPPH